MRTARNHLVLFVRAPRWGAGKRRLARDIGDAAALRFERAMLGLLTRRLGHDVRIEVVKEPIFEECFGVDTAVIETCIFQLLCSIRICLLQNQRHIS